MEGGKKGVSIMYLDFAPFFLLLNCKISRKKMLVEEIIVLFSK